MRTAILGAGCLIFTSAVSGQAPSPDPGAPLTFEVASVKPAAPLPTGGGRGGVGMRGGPGTATPGQINYTYVPLKQILIAAYGVKAYQLTGPAWLDSERYDIVAKVPEGATKDQLNLMLRSLLAERFHLTLHRETKELPVYELVVGKNGPKLKETVVDPNAPPPAPPDPGTPLRASLDKDGFPQLPAGRAGMMAVGSKGRMRVVSRMQTLSVLINMMENQLGRPVVDKTGLTGKYDFNLEFSTEGLAQPAALAALLPPAPPGGAPIDAQNEGGPSVFEAFDKQLGLKLESKKDPIEMLVLDSVDKVPTDN
jgi:uncharacterized protein (TIGR03435 family)